MIGSNGFTAWDSISGGVDGCGSCGSGVYDGGVVGGACGPNFGFNSFLVCQIVKNKSFFGDSVCQFITIWVLLRHLNLQFQK